jgi:hypothetical protein
MRGLDPRIHDERQHKRTYVSPYVPKRFMDCRVKPGNDAERPYEHSFRRNWLELVPRMTQRVWVDPHFRGDEREYVATCAQLALSSPRRRGPIRRDLSMDCGVWVPGLAHSASKTRVSALMALARDDRR